MGPISLRILLRYNQHIRISNTRGAGGVRDFFSIYNGNVVIFNMGILYREWRELGEGKGLIAPYYR